MTQHELVPTIDLAAWRAGDRSVAEQLDRGARHVGFFQVVGHGVPTAVGRGLLDEMRRWDEHFTS